MTYLDAKSRLAGIAGTTNWFRVVVAIQLVALLGAAMLLTIMPVEMLGGAAVATAGLHAFAATSRPVVALYGLILTAGVAWGLWALLRPAPSPVPVGPFGDGLKGGAGARR
jgi:hypothetical protein